MIDDVLRPCVSVLTPDQVSDIVGQAIDVLTEVGFEVEHEGGLALLGASDARLAGKRAFVGADMVHRALASAPGAIALSDRDLEDTLDLSGRSVHFDPGSAALNVADPRTRRWRPATAQDCARMAWVTQRCRHIRAQSTSLVPQDVDEPMGDRYRLYIALSNCTKPVITGTFHTEAFPVMRDMLAAVRGSEQALRAHPLAIFDCCPTPPLEWSALTTAALLDCARAGIPAALVSVPLGGATSPVTLREMVVQHCAESLSGLVMHQLAGSGSPILWGGAPSAFDMRQGTTPMGAIESVMVNVANVQIGRHLGLPTHGYLAVSDAKSVDWQSGAETAQGAVLAALVGVNMASGPGMLGFLACQSLEKLLLDDEACGAALRLVAGISQGSRDQAVGLMADVAETGHFLGHPHTRRSFRKELLPPSSLIDRSCYGDWEAAGGTSSFEAAAEAVEGIVAAGNPAPLEGEVQGALDGLIAAEAARWGMPVPPRPW